MVLASSVCSRCWSTPFNRPLQYCTQSFTLTLGHRFYVATREATTTVTVLAAAAAETQQYKRRRLSEPEAQPSLPTGPLSARGRAAKAQPASFTPTDVPFGLLRVRGLAPGGNAYAHKDCACVGGGCKTTGAYKRRRNTAHQAGCPFSQLAAGCCAEAYVAC